MGLPLAREEPKSRRPRPTGHPPSVIGAGPLWVRTAARVSGGAAGPPALSTGSGAGSALGSAAQSGGRRRRRKAPRSSAAAMAAAAAPPLATAPLPRSAGHHGKCVSAPPRSITGNRGSAAAGHDGKWVARPGRHGGRRGEAGPWPGRHLPPPCASRGAGRPAAGLHAGPLAKLGLL